MSARTTVNLERWMPAERGGDGHTAFAPGHFALRSPRATTWRTLRALMRTPSKPC